MRLWNQKLQIRISLLIFSTLFLIIGLLTVFYWFDFLIDPKWPAIISGLLTGFVVALFQAGLSWYEFKKMDEYDALRIIKILPRRDDREYYENLISMAKKQVCVQSVTAQRFLEHFANKESSREGAKVLLAALGRGVEVKILIPSKKFLTEEKDRKKTEMAKPRLEELSNQFRGKFKYAYFDHQPAHSIVTIDDESIVGPVLPGLSSELTPAIHLKNDSEFVKYYLKYFDDEWKQWSNDKELQQN